MNCIRFFSLMVCIKFFISIVCIEFFILMDLVLESMVYPVAPVVSVAKCYI